MIVRDITCLKKKTPIVSHPPGADQELPNWEESTACSEQHREASNCSMTEGQWDITSGAEGDCAAAFGRQEECLHHRATHLTKKQQQQHSKLKYGKTGFSILFWTWHIMPFFLLIKSVTWHLKGRSVTRLGQNTLRIKHLSTSPRALHQ